jgi:hypothetical protein
MPNKYASGKYAIAECDRCGFRYKLHELKTEILKTKPYRVKVCKACWNPDQPQLQLGLYPVSDPQAVREPRPDVSYYVGGQTGVYTNLFSANPNAADEFGYPTDGSRQFQWGYNPVGGAGYFDRALTPNSLIPVITIGNVTIVTT